MDQYKEVFISEAKDHIDVLNDCLLVLEKDSADMDNLNKLFRAFHTLKGNAATMGFMKFSELAHSLEDVLSKIRDKELKVTQEIMDLIFEGCDVLENGLSQIEAGNPEAIEAESLIKELKDAMGIKVETFDITISKVAELSKSDLKKVNSFKKKKHDIFRVILVFDAGNVLKTAKALVILRDISDVSEIIKTTPVSDEIKKGRFATEIEIVLATKKTKEEIKGIIDKVAGISHVFVLELDESYEKPEIAEHKEKEHAKAEITTKHQAEVVKQIQSVKVSMSKLDKLMNLVGELLISNIRLQDIDSKKEYKSLKNVLAGVDRLILDLQEEVMQARMVPIGYVFNRFPRMVRDLAKKEGKKINFVMEGQDIEFDRTVLDQIGDPLVHLIRNSVDHGVEKPDDRLNLGKEEAGMLKLCARRDKNNAVIEIIDDGAGIDPVAVKESSIRKDKLTQEQADKMTDEELQMMIFMPGVSTNKVVTEISGRGVGMDVVKSKVEELGGNVILHSEVNKGTKVIIQLPLTVAIIMALLIEVNKDIYIVPLTSVDETVDVKRDEIKTIMGKSVFILRGTEIPVFFLHDLLGYTEFDKGSKDKYTVLVVNKNNSKVGLVVDEIRSQQQVLIKSLQDLIKGTKGVSGATILGDGRIALILDVGTLI